jgi:hypothetical protein
MDDMTGKYIFIDRLGRLRRVHLITVKTEQQDIYWNFATAISADFIFSKIDSFSRRDSLVYSW